MSFYDWMLAIHILAAFAIGAALVLYAVLVVASRRASTVEDARLLFRLSRLGGPLSGIGMVIALIVGIILAIDAEDFSPWDPWIIAAYVLWLAVGGLGQRAGAYYVSVQQAAESGATHAEVMERLRAPTGLVLHLLTWAAFILLLLDMLFKPGA